MTKQTRLKQERIIEAVRRQLEGDAAIEFLHASGYAMTSKGLARHLRTMGGRGRIEELLEQGCSNMAILTACFPEDDLAGLEQVFPPSQGELFEGDPAVPRGAGAFGESGPLYQTVKLTLRVPAELYEALRLAARGEQTSQNQLAVDILTAALSRMPGPLPEEDGE